MHLKVQCSIQLRWLVAIAGLLAACGSDSTPPPVQLIPLPAQLTIEPGSFEIRADARIGVSPGAEAVGELLGAVLRRSTGYSLPVTTGADQSADITLTLEPALGSLGPEGYSLTVGDRVDIRASTTAGLFYGAQTLRQLLPPEIEADDVVTNVDWRVARVTIRDQPRFGWRGSMLDVARHFFSVAEVQRYIDLCAYHKLNRLHLHLTDDQGWRIHIDSWPRLTSVGGSTEVGGGAGGFYTKADYAQIIAYAAARFVTIVPEIDLPGHTNAALASYGELNESGQPTELYTGTDVGFSSLWIDGAITLTFVSDVIGELAAMTPGNWIHIGGDEAMATPGADYDNFIQAVQRIVTDNGKTLIGWEEVSSANLAAPFVAQYWLRERDAYNAVDRGAQLIVSPATNAYLDIKYDTETPIGLSWVGFTDVDKAYQWDPVLVGLNEGDILGVEAPLWTETVTTIEEVELMAFPRLPGHAEIAWSPASGREWLEYRDRLAHHGLRLDALNVNYYRSTEIEWLR